MCLKVNFAARPHQRVAARLRIANMTHFMPERKYDVTEARKEFDVIRALKQKPAQQGKAIASLKKQFGITTSGVNVVCGLPSTEADSAMQVFTEFLGLYAELNNLRRKDLQPTASIYYGLPASQAEQIRWKVLKGKYSNPPYLVRMIPTCLVGTCASHLNDQLEVARKQALNTTPGYILEPYWTDIVTVLENADICPIRDYSGVMKSGNPPRYFWKETPNIELKGTTNPNQKGCMYNFGPCRSLTCPATFVSQTRKCSRCKQAQYCSADCQKVTISTISLLATSTPEIIVASTS